MNVIVCVRQVLDTRLALEITKEGVVAQRESSPIFVMNPADRCALEEAIRIRDVVKDCQITAIAHGPKRAELVLADCLARGADRAIHLLSEDSQLSDPFDSALALSTQIRGSGFDLILCGDTSLDDGPSEVGPILAEMLGIPQVTGVAKLIVSDQAGKLIGERKLERGYRQVVEVELPALVGVDCSICLPRYVSIRASRYAIRTLDQNCSIVQPQQCDCRDHELPIRQVLRRSPPRPRLKKITQPDSGMSAEERMAMMMGGVTPTKSGQAVIGEAEHAADDVIAFLKEKGMLA